MEYAKKILFLLENNGKMKQGDLAKAMNPPVPMQNIYSTLMGLVGSGKVKREGKPWEYSLLESSGGEQSKIKPIKPVCHGPNYSHRVGEQSKTKPPKPVASESEKIKVSQINDRQKLIIEKGLCDYSYIMTHWQVEGEEYDFREVYYDFYLKARPEMRKPGNADPYFKKLKSIGPADDLLSILDDLKQTMESKSDEFSFATKLLHTRNDKSPIYDSKIKEYLSNVEGVDFWWYNTPKAKDDAYGKSQREKIAHDWEELNKWYDNFITSKRGIEWIRWFDTNFPKYVGISDVKKIDFIIFSKPSKGKQ